MTVTETRPATQSVNDAVMLRAIFEREEYRQVREAILADTHARQGLHGVAPIRPRSLRPRTT
jgi:hypothetical protein